MENTEALDKQLSSVSHTLVIHKV